MAVYIAYKIHNTEYQGHTMMFVIYLIITTYATKSLTKEAAPFSRKEVKYTSHRGISRANYLKDRDDLHDCSETDGNQPIWRNDEFVPDQVSNEELDGLVSKFPANLGETMELRALRKSDYDYDDILKNFGHMKAPQKSSNTNKAESGPEMTSFRGSLRKAYGSTPTIQKKLTRTTHDDDDDSDDDESYETVFTIKRNRPLIPEKPEVKRKLGYYTGNRFLDLAYD
jgi:hypothetical protein